MSSRFRLVVVAVDSYAEMSALPSSTTAAQLFELLQPFGADAAGPPASTTASEIRQFLDAWATAKDGPASSILYWVGHGEHDGERQWLLTSSSKRPYTRSHAIPADELAEAVIERWLGRVAADPEGWTVVVLDCCNAEVGTTNMLNVFTRSHERRPRRIALVRVASGASTVGHFVGELRNALSTYTENDDTISLRGLLLAVGDRLGDDVDAIVEVPARAALVHERPATVPLTVNLALLREWRDVVATLEPEQRAHFLQKAQSAQIGELAWHFSGRHHESRALANWLRSSRSGLLVVSGEPGAGKSALLGQAVVLSQAPLRDVLARAGLLPKMAPEELPPIDAFDDVIHLTGKTLGDVISRVSAMAADEQDRRPLDARSFLDRVRGAKKRVTVLFDALDEAQDPVSIARDVLRPLAEIPNAKVIVGTRRSLAEGPDRPEAGRHDLLEALGVEVGQTLYLAREPAAMAEYVARRLGGHPQLAPEVVTEAARRIASVDQPFLFVRLLTEELLARAQAGLAIDLDHMLSRNHRELFGLAMERLEMTSPLVVTLLRALAYGRGRGVPRVDRTWASVARSLDPLVAISESTLDEALNVASAYVTLDGELGQSVYRLAHQTFAEHFTGSEGELDAIHTRIARDLLSAVEAAGGWPQANTYVLAHVLDHAQSDGSLVEGICTDPAFLAEVLDRLGVDVLVERLASAKSGAGSAAVAAVAGAVRRARVALARDSSQLAGQLYARLFHEADQPLVRLVARLGEIAPHTWLRALTPQLSWKVDVEAIQDFPKKVRAISFGRLRGSTVLAVGAGDELWIWDPRSGSPERSFLPTGGRITGVALGELRGRPVALLASYDDAMTVRDLASGEVLTRISEPGPTVLCLGMLDGREVVVGGEYGQVRWWDAFSGELLGTELLPGASAVGVACTEKGLLVASATDRELEVRWLGRGEPVRWAHQLAPPAAVAAAEIDQRLLVAIARRGLPTMLVSWEWLGPAGLPLGAREVDFAVRTLALGEVEGTVIAALGDDRDEELGYVALRDPQVRDATDWRMLWGVAPVAVGRVGGRLVALSEGKGGTVRLLDVLNQEVVRAAPTAAEVAHVLAGPGHDHLRFAEVGAEVTRLLAVRLPSYTPTTTFKAARPKSWPPTAETYGVVNGRPVHATGSYAGAAWVWDLESRELLAGPFAEVPKSLPASLVMAKPGVPAVRSMSMCHSPDRSLLATVCDGLVGVWDIESQERVLLPDLGNSSAVALGTIEGRELLARGSDRGGLSVWDVGSGERLAALTLDGGVQEIWFIPGERSITAMTSAFRLLVFAFS